MSNEQNNDPWKHRSEGMRCGTCVHYVRKSSAASPEPCGGGWKAVRDHSEPEIGRFCRRAPTMNGFPVVYPTDWCCDHRLDENKLNQSRAEVQAGTINLMGELGMNPEKILEFARTAAEVLLAQDGKEVSVSDASISGKRIQAEAEAERANKGYGPFAVMDGGPFRKSVGVLPVKCFVDYVQDKVFVSLADLGKLVPPVTITGIAGEPTKLAPSGTFAKRGGVGLVWEPTEAF